MARVYAEALLDAAQKRDEIDRVLEEFSSLFEDLLRAVQRVFREAGGTWAVG